VGFELVCSMQCMLFFFFSSGYGGGLDQEQ
jgi:hypothetical protein